MMMTTSQAQSRLRRANDPCALCHIRPRKIYPSGPATRCEECLRESGRERKARMRANERAGIGTSKGPKLCATCGEQPRHVTYNGLRRSYCRDCLAKNSSLYKSRKRAERREQRLVEREGAAQEQVERVLNVTNQSVELQVPETPELPMPIPAPEPQGRSLNESVYGLITDMLLLLDRSRDAVSHGEIARMRLSLSVDGVQMSMQTEEDK